MFLSKLTINVRSREFRRDYVDIHQMHRTIMSAFPAVQDDRPARQAHGVLWRLEPTRRGFELLVQSFTRPDWSTLAAGYLECSAQIREIDHVLKVIQPGRKLAFRLVANPTRAVSPGINGQHSKRFAHHRPEKQIEWLVRQGERHGFVLPLAKDGQPDVAPSPCPTLRGRKVPSDKAPERQQGPDEHESPHGQSASQQASQQPHTIVIEPVRYDGHLVITDPEAFQRALLTGIGRAKAYGCGLLSLAPARTVAVR